MVKCYGKNRMRTTILRTIRQNFPRFISLTVMSFLGVFAFAGLMATAPDMILTLDKHLDDHNVYDIQVISDLGLSDSDAEALSNLDGVEIVEPSRSVDTEVSCGDSNFVARISSLPTNLNHIDLLEGRMPEKRDEIVVEKNLLELENLSIGSKLTLGSDKLKEKEVTIVGTVDSPLYYNNVEFEQDRGSTSIGSGTISYYAYGLDDIFDFDYYTAIYLTVSGALDQTTSEKGYTSLVDNVLNEIDAIKAERVQARYDEIFADSEDEIKDVEADYNKAFDDAGITKSELSSTITKVKDGIKELESGVNSLDTYILELKAHVDDYEPGSSLADYFNDMISDYEEERDDLQKQLDDLRDKLNDLNNLESIGISLQEAKQILNEKKADYTGGPGTEKNSDTDNEESLNSDEISDKIDDYLDELRDLSLPTWYKYDRTGYSTYGDYIDSSNSIRNLATIFPAVFFAVAVLVSLISMNRMVEENRLEIGTFKSMGFPDSMIMDKYLVFSLLATVVGSALGAASGLIIIPEMIYNIYSILFSLPSLVLTIQPLYTAIGFLLTVLCVCGTSLWTVYKVLKEKPAELLRPKPPKNGKRVLLENIPFIWKNMKFSNKVTARNIFRYKKRAFVTIAGVAGCTALMLTGFGIRDAIVDLPGMQYHDIFDFGAELSISDYGETGIVADDFLKYDGVTAAVPAQYITATIEGKDGYLEVVESNEALQKVTNFKDYKTNERLNLEHGKAIISEKLATVTGKKVGDMINLVDVDKNTISLEISGITNNYVWHFVFIDAETYSDLGYEFKPNMVYLNTTELSQAEKDSLVSKILLNDEVVTFAYSDALIKDISDSLESLNSVVAILIVLSALLSFVVFYNLSNININERQREIATLKVLGFYDGEVDNYITKENIILTLLGIAIGLIIGIYLSHTVVSSIEVEEARFLNEIKPMSYVLSAVMTAFFTGIVNVITHFNLKKINMIDSLKSVE